MEGQPDLVTLGQSAASFGRRDFPPSDLRKQAMVLYVVVGEEEDGKNAGGGNR